MGLQDDRRSYTVVPLTILGGLIVQFKNEPACAAVECNGDQFSGRRVHAHNGPSGRPCRQCGRDYLRDREDRFNQLFRDPRCSNQRSAAITTPSLPGHTNQATVMINWHRRTKELCAERGQVLEILS